MTKAFHIDVNLKMKGGENMKKILRTLVLFVVAVFLTAGSAGATLIGVDLTVPDIFSDSTGHYTYNATTDLFAIQAMALTVTYDGVNLIPIYLGDFKVQFYVDGSGNFTNGIGGNDLEIMGSSTPSGPQVTLLSGEITNFGWLDAGQYALFDYTFQVTGGSLASLFGNSGGSLSTSEISSFNDLWNVDHSGTKVKTDTASVPEPGTLLLLGSGFAGLAFYGRMRRRKQ